MKIAYKLNLTEPIIHRLLEQGFDENKESLKLVQRDDPRLIFAIEDWRSSWPPGITFDEYWNRICEIPDDAMDWMIDRDSQYGEVGVIYVSSSGRLAYNR